jgi:parallel beta-helix repeat protein
VVLDPTIAGTAGLIYGSYFGGSGDETMSAMVLSGGVLYLGGNTPSASGVATVGAYDTTRAGASDGYIAAFAVHAAPDVNVDGSTLSYSEGSGFVVVDATLTVADGDSANLTGAIVAIAANYVGTEDLLDFSNTNPWGITGTWNAGTGTLTLSGVAPVASYQSALRSIRYSNSSDNPSTATRSISFVVDDGYGSSAAEARPVAVSATNDPPVIASNGGGATASVTVQEHTVAVTTVTAADVDLPAQTLTYSISGGADAARFTIGASTGVLRFVTAPDYEAPSDANADNVYVVTVRASDGVAADTQTLSVSVSDIGMVLDQFNATSYAGNDGTQNWSTNWQELGETNSPTSGVSRVSSGAWRLGGDEVSIAGRGIVREADLSGASVAVLTFDYQRVEVDDEGGGSVAVQVSGNGGGAWTTLATYSLSSFDGSFQSAQFDISAYAAVNTQVRFLGSGSVEAYFYADNVRIEHNGAAGNDAPVIGSDGGGDEAALDVAENSTAVTTVTAADADLPAQALSFSIVGGADQALFTLDAATGVLQFATARDFEAPADADLDNVYEVLVQVDDGNGGSDLQSLQVSVLDLDEAPSVSGIADQTIDHDTPLGPLPFTVADPESAAATLSVIAVSSNQTLVPDGSIVLGGSGANRTVSLAPAAGQSGSATITLQVSDGVNVTTQAFVLTVNPENTPPTIVPDSFTVAENSAAGTGVGTVVASDPDVEESFSKIYYADATTGSILRASLNGSGVQTLVTGLSSPGSVAVDHLGGKVYWTDSATGRIGRANLDGSGAQTVVSGLSAPVALKIDAEGGKVYWIEVGTPSIKRANLDGSMVETVVSSGLSDPRALDLDMVNGRIYWADDGSNAIRRANLDGSGVQTLISGLSAPRAIALDVSGGKLYWADQGTARIGRANLDGSGMQASFLTVGSDVEGLAVDTVRDQIYWTDNDLLGAHVRRANLDGTGISTVVTTGLALLSDPTAVTLGPAVPALSYAITGGNTGGAFAIDGTGRITVSSPAAIDFEANPAFVLAVQVTDAGGAVSTQTINVSLTNVNEAPALVALSGASVDENTDTSGGFAVGTLSTTDPDAADTFTYGITGGADQAKFSVAGNQLVLTDGVLDFEAKSSYSVQVTGTDAGGLTVSQTFVISVTNVNDAPTISVIPAQVIPEDSSTGTIAFTISDPETAAGSLVLTAFSSDTTRIPNANIVLGGSGENRTVTVTPAANAYGGPVNVTVRVSDGTNIVQRTFPVAITGVADTPNVTNASTMADTQTTSGLVITGNILDGAEVTHFKITGITGGTLYQADGATPIANDEFITVAQGNAGLKFTPDAGSTADGSFQVQGSTSPSNGGLGGGVSTATISVNDAPVIVAPADVTVSEDGSIVLAFDVSDTESAAGTLAVTASSGDDSLIPTGSLVLGGSGGVRSILITPAPDAYGGPVTITLSVSDGLATILATFEVTVAPVVDSVVTVDTTSDVSDGDTSSIDALLMNRGADGMISLREAIEAANNGPNAGGADRIEFDIAGAGPHRIDLLAALPVITEAVVIDGTTDPDYAGTPIIELNGAGAGSDVDGLVLLGDASVVRGLVINRFDGSGIVLEGGGGHIVAGNFIGLGANGASDQGNSDYGIWIRSDGNIIGGTSAVERNVVSGNDIDGIHIDGAADNVVQGNYIGTDAAGMNAVGNAEDGIWLAGASDNLIGGTAAGAGNLLSGNQWSGIGASGLSQDNTIQGNYIGVDAAGTGALGNQRSGVRIEDGTGTLIGGAGAARNVIAHNALDGVAIASGSGHSVLENAIYANGGLGIDLDDDDVTTNDAGDGDAGTNAGMNAPVLYSVVLAGGNVTIQGEARAGATVRFFQADVDPSGYGEGRTFLGSVAVSGATAGQVDATARRFSVTFAAGALTAADSITATATDASGNTSEFALCVDGLNDAPTAVMLSGAPPSEGQDTTGGQSVGTLSSSDPEILDTHTYTIVGGPDAALFSISSDTLLLDAGVLDYETRSTYVVTVRSTDSGGLTHDQSLTIAVANVNDAPVLVGSSGTTVAWGGTAVIGSGALQVSDVDNSTAQLVYTLTAAPGAGTLRLSGAVLGVNATFTQADIDAGRVSYVHNAAGGGPDGFSVTVSDGSAGLGPVAVSVGIGSPPIIVIPEPVGPPAPPPAPTEPEPSPTDTTTDPEPSDTSSSDSGTGGAGGSIPAPVDGGGGIAPGMEGLLDEGLISSTDSAAAQRGSARIIFTDAFSLRAQWNALGYASAFGNPNLLAGDATDAVADTADLSLPDLALRNGAAVSQSVALASFRASLGDTEWMTELNRMREDIDAQLPQQSALVVSSVAVTGSLSVGYVLWLLRGGLLLSSLLSSLPAWTVIDPMPVLSRSGHDDEDEGDDPLEKLFGRARAALGLKRGKAARAARDTAEEVS